MSDWQPIETAPKDGQQVLLGWAGATDLQIVRWMEGRQRWCVNYGGWGEDRYEQEASMRWMPLPEAPK